MLNALWLAPLIFWLSRGYDDPESSPLDTLYFGLTALFWIGHRLSSTWLAYCTEAYRPLLRTQPIRFVVFPILITLGCFAIFLPPDNAMPWTRAERLIALAILDYVLVTHHFASQHFGVLSLYRSRAGRTHSRETRRMDRWFALGVGGVLVFAADILAGSVAYQDVWIDSWVPAWLVDHQEAIRYTGITILTLAAVAMLARELRSPQRSLPRLLYILGLTIMVALAFRPRSLFLFLVIWTSQHWILATGLASQTPSAAPAPQRGGLIRRSLHALNTRPWAVLLLLVAISVMALPLFEVEANRQGGTFYGDRIFGAIATGLRDSTWVPPLIALGFATGFLHYLLDRNVYRMSNPQVRQAAAGLLNVPAPVSRAVKIPAPSSPSEALVIFDA